jgi:hypothetical protein
MTAAPGALVKFIEQMKAATGIDLTKRLQEIVDMPDEQTPEPVSDRVQPSAEPEESADTTEAEEE